MKTPAELTEKHVENLRALSRSPTGVIKSRLPHPRHVGFLVKNNLADATGTDWISTVDITRNGRWTLARLDEK